jgi:RNA polymerase sigma-70 factor (ECF subfamily)
VAASAPPVWKERSVAAIELEHVVVGWSPDRVLALYDDLSTDLHGYALAIARDPSAADDLVQEAFLRLLNEDRRGRAPDDARAWVFRVCTNLVRSGFRRRAVADRRRSSLVSNDLAESAEATVIRSEEHRQLHDALGALPMEVRMALMLSAEGFSGREIARALGRSEGATRNLLWRGRLELRRVLSGEGVR